MGKRDRYATAAGTEVQHVCATFRGEPFQRSVDQNFGVGARNEYVRGHQKIQTVKFPETKQIGDRFAATATFDEFPNTGCMRRIDCRGVVRGKPGAGHAQRMAKQDLSFTFRFDVTGELRPRRRASAQRGNSRLHGERVFGHCRGRIFRRLRSRWMA